jgi:hypothetical protein
VRGYRERRGLLLTATRLISATLRSKKDLRSRGAVDRIVLRTIAGHNAIDAG